MEKKRVAIGQEFFKEFKDDNRYFVDKSLLIKDLIDGEVATLFTRPRRFGKTLNMNMIKTFFEDERDWRDGTKIDNSKYFEDLKIWKAGDRYLEHFGKYPVITITLKEAKKNNFESAMYKIRLMIAEEFDRHSYVLKSDALSDEEREKFIAIRNEKASDDMYESSLKTLSYILKKVHNQNVVILIDEYDVPLESAYYNEFYDKMVNFIRSFMSSALKTNSALKKAVVTGCLRISKESIFTGLNNLDVISILTTEYGEHFGFTQNEVDELLEYYGIKARREECKKWYDGYLFGETEVYNPWSIINFVRDSVSSKNKNLSKPYWDNTSSNSIIRDLIERADLKVKGEIENLISSGTIEAKIHEDITYDDVDKDQDNLYNFLFFTGYLKMVNTRDDGEDTYATLKIPNEEIRRAYKRKISEWVNRALEKNIKENKLEGFYEALFSKDAETMEDVLNKELMETISYFDANEAYYHGFLAGLLKGIPYYKIESNKESGEGRFDIALVPGINDREKLIIIEVKVADRPNQMEAKCIEGLNQVIDKNYKQKYIDDLYYNIDVCAIAFCKKRCRVRFD